MAEVVSGGEEKEPVPLVDYVLNVMKFVDAILSNNSTDDHCREFVSQKGLGELDLLTYLWIGVSQFF